MERVSRLPALTGLRWVAAVVVFGQHLLEQFFDPDLVASAPVKAVLWAALVDDGALGVSFFFVLSGFVLAWSAKPGQRPGTFWWRRFTKIYPATLVTTLAAMVIVGGAGPVQILTHLTLTQSWVPDGAVYGALNPVSWSLSVEACFYLCFPLLLAGLRRLGPVGLRVLGAGLAAFVLVLAVALVALPHPAALWIGYLCPPVRMAEFTVGIAAALLVRQDAWRGPGLRWSLLLVLPPAAVAVLMPFPVNQHALTLVPVTLVVAAAARGDVQGIATVWNRPTMVYLGELSFAFYLVHYLVFVAFERLGMLPHHAHPLVAALAATSVLSFSVLAAMLVYHGVELPALRLLRHRAPGRHIGAPAVPQPRAAVSGPAQPVSPSMR